MSNPRALFPKGTLPGNQDTKAVLQATALRGHGSMNLRGAGSVQGDAVRRQQQCGFVVFFKGFQSTPDAGEIITSKFNSILVGADAYDITRTAAIVKIMPDGRI